MKKLIPAALVFIILGSAVFAQTVTVTSPTASSHWCMGDSRDITWTSSGVSGDVRLRLFRNGVVVGNIVFAVAYNASPYAWVVGTLGSGNVIPGSGYTVGVRLGSGTVFQSSPFEIKAAGTCGGGRPALSVSAGSQPMKDYRIEVIKPVLNRRLEMGQYFDAVWKTQADPPFEADLVGEDGVTLVYPCGTLTAQEVRNDEFSAKMLITPGATPRVASGWYRIRIRSKQNTHGLGPRIHLARPIRKVTVELPPSLIRDRHSCRVINNLGECFVGKEEPTKSGLARAGSHFYYVGGPLTQDRWIGKIFRSQVVFPVEQVDMAEKTLTNAWVYIEPNGSWMGSFGSASPPNSYKPLPSVNGGGIIFALTGPWSGNCIDTPGVPVGNLPQNASPYSLHIKDLVEGWLLRTKPNHGLLIGSRWEPFDLWQWANFQLVYWYKATLVMEFEQEQ